MLKRGTADLDDVQPGDGGLACLPGSHNVHSSIARPDGAHNPYGSFGEQQVGHDAAADLAARSRIDDGIVAKGFTQLCVSAGDILVVPEALTHCVLPWLPRDRARRVLMLRYVPQHSHASAFRLFPSPVLSTDEGSHTWLTPFPPEVSARLSPETLELARCAHFTHVKDIAMNQMVNISGRACNACAVARL